VPRTVKLFLTTNQLPSSYIPALDAAITRYNNLNLAIRFQRTTSLFEMAASHGIFVGKLNNAPPEVWGASGFPSGGDPFTNIAHEMGHCIGFRHTDFGIEHLAVLWEEMKVMAG
jgi:hypothetical protein